MSWSFELSLGGTTYTYPSGTALKNYFVANPAPGIYNVHLGDILALEADVINLGPHHVKIIENGVTILDADNDRHGWNQEWTHRTGPFVLHMTPAQITAAKLLPAYGPNGNAVGGVNNYKFVGPFYDSAGVTIYMPTTGERPDIGMITDPAGLYMLSGQSGPMLAWARAGGSCPMHLRDAATGLPLSIPKYAGFNMYDLPGYQGDPVPGTLSPYGWKGPRASNGYPTFFDNWAPQVAHYCDMHYLAAVVTRDPVFLKDLQEAAVFTLGSSAEIFLPDGRRVHAGEYRGVAHALGMTIKARAATIHAEGNGWFVPGFHQVSSHFDLLLAPSVQYYMGQATTNPGCARFNVFPQGASTLGPWQHAYLVMDLGLGVLTGAPGMEPLFIHAIKNTVARFSNKSGWPPAYSGYYLDLHADDTSLLPNWGAVFDQFYHAEQANAATAAAHGSSYTPAIDKATYDNLKANPLNGFVIQGTTEYMWTDRAGLVFADYLEKLGLCNVRAQVPDFDAALANVEAFFHKTGGVNARVALADPGVIPPVIVPPTPTQVKDLHMSTPFSLAASENSKQLNLTVSPPDGDLSSLSYRAAPADVVTLTPNAAGVLVSRITGKKGAVAVFADVVGVGGTVEAESDGVVAGPLVASLSLDPAS